MTPERFMVEIRYLGEPHIPDGSDPQFIMDCYLEELRNYNENVLKIAAKRLIKGRKHRNFPMPEECTRVCDAVHEEFARKAERDGTGPETRRISKGDPRWSEARIREADRLMNSEIGRLAASEDWIVHLHDFCRENGRLPNHLESERVRRDGLAIKSERERLAQSASGAIGLKIVASVAQAMNSKRKRLSGLAYGRG